MDHPVYIGTRDISWPYFDANVDQDVDASPQTDESSSGYEIRYDRLLAMIAGADVVARPENWLRIPLKSVRGLLGTFGCSYFVFSVGYDGGKTIDQIYGTITGVPLHEELANAGLALEGWLTSNEYVMDFYFRPSSSEIRTEWGEDEGVARDYSEDTAIFDKLYAEPEEEIDWYLISDIIYGIIGLAFSIYLIGGWKGIFLVNAITQKPDSIYTDNGFLIGSGKI